MAMSKNPTTTDTSFKPSDMNSRPSSNARIVQNFHLVWLDGIIDQDNNDDCRNSIIKLRQVVNAVNTFIDVDECIDFITDKKEDKILVMFSGAFSQITVAVVQDIPQVSSVYIFGENKIQYEKWVKEWPKVKGVFTDITSICEALKQAAQDCDQNSVSISFVKNTDGASTQNLDTLDQSFMYTQILKEILLTIDFEQKHINEFLTYCRTVLAGNNAELKNVDKLEKEYRSHQPIWWYTFNSFLYSMLNRALRLMEVDLIVKLGFFVRDLHNHIDALHAEQYTGDVNSNPFIVYRGQGLSQTDFDQLKQTQGGLLSFNNFLSTSKNSAVSLAFARRTMATSDLVGVLFVLNIDPPTPATPFANVGNVSYFKGEEEILFSMHSVFRIGQVKQIEGNTRLWQVDLTLTGDNDSQLQALTENMHEEIQGSTGWHRLGKLMIKLGQLNEAEELYGILLQQASNEGEQGLIFNYLGQIKDAQGKYAEAIGFFEKSLEIFQKTVPANHLILAASYNNIGEVYRKMGDYSKAFPYYEKSLEIKQKTRPPNHPDLAISYNNIGMVYDNMGEYSKALSYYEKALQIHEKTLPANHPDLATAYNNIGSVYDAMREYSKALSYYTKDLEILQKTLPASHPDLATSYNNIGAVCYNVGECSKALSYYEKALEIFQKTLPANHPRLGTSNNNIGEVYSKMGEYSKALLYYEKALQIFAKTLPANHPSLAISYNNIGMVYDNMGEYAKALSYYEKALKIRQKALPPNHPDLAASYNYNGAMYLNKSEYSKALSYYEKALEIFQKTLPADHSDIAQTFQNIGLVYYRMGEYSNALSYYEKAVEIDQKYLPANYSRLASSFNNIGAMYYKMGEYSKALSYFERALTIWQLSLPPNHLDIKSVKQSIEIVKNKL